MAQPLRIGDLLLQAQVITPLHLNAALEEQRKWGGRLGSILVRMGALDEDMLVQALSHQLQIPLADFRNAQPPVGILAKIERSVWAKHSMCPLSYDNTNATLLVAVSDPFDVVGADEISARLGVRVQSRLAGEKRVLDTLDTLYGASIPAGEPVLEMIDNQGHTRPPGNAVESAEGPPAFAPQGAPRAPAPRAPAPRAPAAEPAPPSARPRNIAELAELAEQQARSTRAILELLVEKNVLSPTEIAAALGGGPRGPAR